jgi:HEAT repeat protein
MGIMRSVLFLLTAGLLAGCARQPVLKMAHGKPVAHWVAAVRDPDAGVRKKAVVALGHVGTADPAALPALIGALKDPEALVRRQAVLSLLNLGAEARAAVPALEEACQDSDALVSGYARKALAKVRGGEEARSCPSTSVVPARASPQGRHPRQTSPSGWPAQAPPGLG